jgi:hypothetical protein
MHLGWQKKNLGEQKLFRIAWAPLDININKQFAES